MKNRLKILHVINSLSIGGAETLVANSLAPGGLNEQCDNTLVYFRGDSYLSGIIDTNVRQICLSYAGWFELPRVLLKLRRIITNGNFDIIHTHLNPTSFYVFLVCPASIPLMHTIHTTYSMNMRGRKILSFLEKQMYLTRRRCNVICVSDSARDNFVQSVRFSGRVFVLNNFVSDRFFTGHAKKYEAQGKALSMVAVGTLDAVKNFNYLLDVLSFCKNDEISLDIYGKGEREPFNRTIAEKSLKVRMMGECSEISEALRMYDLFIMPSRYEGFPLSLFEAMASGLPVLMSNISPLRSIVKDNGVFFELDNAEATASLLKNILTGRIPLNDFAEKARGLAERTCRREAYTRRLLQIYRTLITCQTKRRPSTASQPISRRSEGRTR